LIVHPSDIDFEAMVKQALDIRQEHDVKKKTLKLKKAAAYLCEVNRYREKCGISRGLGTFGCYSYLFCKALNLANVFLQFFMLAGFVGQGQLGWGVKVSRHYSFPDCFVDELVSLLFSAHVGCTSRQAVGAWRTLPEGGLLQLQSAE